MAAPKLPQQKKPRKLPRFKSLDEEADFWDKHSPLDYGQWKEVKRIKVERPLGHILGVRLDARTIDHLADIGRKKGLGPSTLARMWILERLEEEQPVVAARKRTNARRGRAKAPTKD